MLNRSLIASCLIAVAGSAAVRAGEEAAAPSTQEARKVAAVVGEEKIYVEDLDKAMAYLKQRMPKSVTEEQLAERREMILNSMIERELMGAYLDSLAVTDEEIKAFKARIAKQLKAHGQETTVEQVLAMQGVTDADLARQIKLEREMSVATDPNRVKAYVAKSPASWFDGTTVEASHVLIRVDPYAPEAEQKKAYEKIKALAAKIESGQAEFVEVAKEHSDCPSSAKGGDLGEFTFPSMVKPFSEKAFSMQVGEISEPIKTRFGYHIIKVTGRKDGSGKPNEMAEKNAERLLAGQTEQEMIRKGRELAPVTVR